MPQTFYDSEIPLNEQLCRVLNEGWERDVLKQLPADYEQQARCLGAVQRKRGVSSVADVLRVLLSYVLCVASLRQLGAWAVLIGLADLSHVAWYKRLRKARAWLLWMLQAQLALAAPTPALSLQAPARLVLVDGTRLNQPGGSGDDWRAHLAYDLVGGQLRDVRISDRHTGEGFTLFAWHPGEIVVGDRAYGRAKQVAWVLSQGAEVVVRLSAQQVRLLDEKGHVLDVDAWLSALADGCYEREVRLVDEQGHDSPGRLIACALSSQAAERARAKAKRYASKHQNQVQDLTLRLCRWLLVFTSLGAADWQAWQVLNLYRARWQIELVIKRMKQVLQLAQLRAHLAATNEAVLLALLLSWTLQESEVSTARTVLEQAREQLLAAPVPRGRPASPPAEVTFSTWGLVQLAVQALRVSVQGVWTPSRLRACWSRLARFVCSRRHKRLHQESQLRQFLQTHQPAPATSLFSCSSA